MCELRKRLPADLQAPEVCMEAVGPDSWVQQGVTLANPQLPFYLDPMEGWRRVLIRKKGALGDLGSRQLYMWV